MTEQAGRYECLTRSYIALGKPRTMQASAPSSIVSDDTQAGQRIVIVEVPAGAVEIMVAMQSAFADASQGTLLFAIARQLSDFAAVLSEKERKPQVTNWACAACGAVVSDGNHICVETYCADCGCRLQYVRPGKWQCPECVICSQCGWSTIHCECDK